MNILLTPSSIEYLTEFIFSGVITIYLGRLWWRTHKKGRNSHSLLITVLFALITVFVFLEFLDVSLSPTQRISAMFFESISGALVLIFALQFAYSFPAIAPKRHWEMRIALTLSILYTMWEVQLSAFRFYQLFHYGNVYPRPLAIDLVRAIGGVWVFIVLLRQVVTFSDDAAATLWWRRLWSPKGRSAKAVRNLALVCLLPAASGYLTIANNQYNFSVAAFQLILSIEVFVTLFLVLLVYLDAIAELVSFVTKVAGIALAMTLLVLGNLGWFVSPALTDYYLSPIPSHQTYRFTPADGASAYNVSEVPFQFREDFGQKLAPSGNSSTLVDFNFPFYGMTHQDVYISVNGAATFLHPLIFRNMQYRYGMASGIFPLYMDSITGRPEGNVFVNETPDSLTITWDHVPAFYHPENVFTFQLVLYSTGIFDVTYGDLPNALHYEPGEGPGYNPWLSGIICNEPDVCGLNEQIDPTAGVQWPKEIWGNGYIINYYLDYRRHLNDAMIPLIYLVLGTSSFILIGLPFLLMTMLRRPLLSLLNGMRQVNAGYLDVSLPVYYNDEIGFLTRSFNAMLLRLRDALYNRKALEANPLPLIVVRLEDAKILMANEAAADYFETALKEFHESYLTDGYIDSTLYKNTVQEFKEDGKVINKIVPLKVRSGDEQFAQMNFLPIDWYGETCMIASFADITAHQKVQASLRKSAERWFTLYLASQEIGASFDLENIYSAIHRAVEQVMPCDDFVIDLYDKERNLITPVYVIQPPGERVMPPPYFADHGLAGLVVHTGQSLRLNNPEEIKASRIKFEPYGRDEITSSVLAVPMWYQGKPIGMLSAQSYREEAYARKDEELLEVLAIHAATALENARLFEQARQEIAERKRAEDQLRQQQNELTALEDRERIGRELREWLGEVVTYVNSQVQTEQTQPSDLTSRQWDVLRWVSQGLTYKEVGTKLHLTERAVKYHMAQILERLRLKSRRDAVEYARKLKPRGQ